MIRASRDIPITFSRCCRKPRARACSAKTGGKMSTIRERVMAGEQVLGAMVFEFFTPGIAQIMAHAGCEYLIYDMEHTGTGFETLKDQVSACRGLPVVPMARVPRGEYHFLARALDIGMKGLMIPMVETADEAAAIAEATRYPPVGRRGAGVRLRARRLFRRRPRRQDRARERIESGDRPDRDRARAGKRRCDRRDSGDRRALGRAFRPGEFLGHSGSVPEPGVPGRREGGGRGRQEARQGSGLHAGGRGLGRANTRATVSTCWRSARTTRC